MARLRETEEGRTQMSREDEKYVLDLCDELLGCQSLRGHRFRFLLGDPNTKGQRSMLPVDAYYDRIKLVVEYRERQHSESVRLFDGRMTVSGITRGRQRRRYDQLRREVLPRHGLALVEIDYSELAHRKESKRLISDRQHDIHVIQKKIIMWLPTRSHGAGTGLEIPVVALAQP